MKKLESQETMKRDSSNKSPNNVALNLRSELDLAHKILAQRDVEIAQMKKQAKQLAYAQCNEERILYMNECIKL